MGTWARYFVVVGWMLAPPSSQAFAEVTAYDHDADVYTADFSPDGKQFVSGDGKGVIRFWDIASEKVLCTLKIPESGVGCVVFSKDGRSLYSLSLSKATSWSFSHLTRWDVKTRRVVWQKKFSGWIPGLALAPDGSEVAVGDGSAGGRCVIVCDASTGKILWRPEGGDGYLYGLAYSPDSKLLAIATRDGLVKMVATRTRKKVAEIKVSGVQSVAFSRDGALLAIGSIDASHSDMGSPIFDTLLYDVKKRAVYKGINARCSCCWKGVAFSRDGKVLLIADGGYLGRYDIRTGAWLRRPDCTHSGGISAVVVSRDGKRVLTVGSKTVEVWTLPEK